MIVAEKIKNQCKWIVLVNQTMVVIERRFKMVLRTWFCFIEPIDNSIISTEQRIDENKFDKFNV